MSKKEYKGMSSSILRFLELFLGGSIIKAIQIFSSIIIFKLYDAYYRYLFISAKYL